MPLVAGTRVGPYEIVAPLGAGGMVYRARDTRLGRDVALKTLPDVFARDPERLARFRREAQVLASLNHPNIAAIYGIEEAPVTADGAVERRVQPAQTLVLELVEGPTLADRLSAGVIPVEDALPIARQIAEALEAAHDQGIVHRDLKPISPQHDRRSCVGNSITGNGGVELAGGAETIAISEADARSPPAVRGSGRPGRPRSRGPSRWR